MANINVTLTGDELKLLKSLDKIIQKERQLGDQAVMTSNKSKKGANAVTDAFKGMASQYLSVQGAINIASQAIQMSIEDIKNTAQTARTAIAAIQRQIAGAGDISQYSAISKQLIYDPRTKFLKPTEAADVYGGVRGSLPTADLKQVMDLAGYAGRSEIVMGQGTGKLFGSALGEVSKIFPNLSSKNQADLTMFLSQAMGKYGADLDKTAFKGVQQLTATGTDPMEAMALLLASAEAGQGSRGLAGFASWKLAGGRPDQMNAAVMATLQASKKKDYRGMLEGAVKGGYFESQIGEALKSEDVRTEIFARASQAELERAKYEEGRKNIVNRATREMVEANMYRSGTSPIVRYFAGKAYDFVSGLGFNAPFEQEAQGALNVVADKFSAAIDKNTQAVNKNSDATKPTTLSKPDLDR